MFKSISVIMPTLNAEKYIDKSLKSIFSQKNISDIEVILSDGGSTDNTLKISKRYPIKIIKNKLITAEAGKMSAIKHSTNELLAFIDSDNILNDQDYFANSLHVFNEYKNINCVEPLSYKFNKNDSEINQYCSLMGLNDPFEYYLGRFDKYNIIVDDYTKCLKKNLIINSSFRIDEIILQDKLFPTFGANGTILKKSSISEVLDFEKTEYYFDTDVTNKIFKKQKSFVVCKMHTSITHFYCTSIKQFLKKQSRRISDFLYFNYKEKKDRELPNLPLGKNILILIKFIFILPIIIDSFRLSYKSNLKISPFFHFYLSYLTIIIYGIYFLRFIFKKDFKNLDRKNW